MTGGTSVAFFVEAFHTSAVDDFLFEYSVGGSSWLPLLTVTKNSDDDTTQSASLPDLLSGPIAVQVRDTNRDKNDVLDSISIDSIFIRSQQAGAPPFVVNPEAPISPQIGDADNNGRFDQLDIIQILQAGKYLTGEAATFGEGDFDGNGFFDQNDIVAALQTDSYLKGQQALLSADEVNEVEHVLDVVFQDDHFLAHV